MKAVNEEVLSELEPTQTIVRLGLAPDEGLEAEVNEMWSFVQSRGQQRWQQFQTRKLYGSKALFIKGLSFLKKTSDL